MLGRCAEDAGMEQGGGGHGSGCEKKRTRRSEQDQIAASVEV